MPPLRKADRRRPEQQMQEIKLTAVSTPSLSRESQEMYHEAPPTPQHLYQEPPTSAHRLYHEPPPSSHPVYGDYREGAPSYGNYRENDPSCGNHRESDQAYGSYRESDPSYGNYRESGSTFVNYRESAPSYQNYNESTTSLDQPMVSRRPGLSQLHHSTMSDLMPESISDTTLAPSPYGGYHPPFAPGAHSSYSIPQTRDSSPYPGSSPMVSVYPSEKYCY